MRISDAKKQARMFGEHSERGVQVGVELVCLVKHEARPVRDELSGAAVQQHSN